jgi:hypothetical protein
VEYPQDTSACLDQALPVACVTSPAFQYLPFLSIVFALRIPGYIQVRRD